MSGFNPFTPPKAPLHDSRLPSGFAASGWTAGELQVHAALAGSEAFGLLVLLALLLAPVEVDSGYLQMFSLALLLLWGYLLWRLRLLLADRFHLGALAVPMILQMLCALLLLGSLSLPDAPGGGELLLRWLQQGGVALGLLWLAERLMRRRHQQPLLGALAVTLLLAAAMLVTQWLLAAALCLLVASLLLAALFLQVAAELELG